MSSSVDSAGVLRALVHASARCLDDRRYDDFLALLLPECEYRIEVRSPELAEPMVWMIMNREELGVRFESAASHEWQVYKALELTRMVSVDVIEPDEPGARASSNLAVFATDEEGHSRVYAVGRYDDRWVQADDGFLLRERVVRLRTRILDTPTPMPL